MKPFLASLTDLDIVRSLGTGDFGEVFVADYGRTGTLVAAKKLWATGLDEPQFIEFCRDVQLLAQCDNPFLLPILRFTDSNPFVVLTPYLDALPLSELLGTSSLDGPAKQRIAIGIAHGMARLHEMGVPHGNLKASNILVDKSKFPHIVDIGLGRFRDVVDGAPKVRNIGAPHWMAPELFSENVQDERSDIYAFGMILWEMLNEKPPFADCTHIQIALGVSHGERPALPPTAPAGLAALIRACWAANPDERPDFLNIYLTLTGKIAMFPKAERADIDGFSSYIEAVGGAADPCGNVSVFIRDVRSPQTLFAFLEKVTEETVLQFSREINDELTVADDERLARLFELIFAAIRRAPFFVRALLEAGTIEHVRWDKRAPVEYQNRLIAEAAARQPRAFRPAIYSHLIATSLNAHPITIIQALSAHFQAFDPSADSTLFSEFLDWAPVLTRGGGAPSFVQILSFMFFTFNSVCHQFIDRFQLAIYWCLESGHARAIHDVYVLYAYTVESTDWPMENALLLKHLEMPEVCHSVLSYLLRAYTPEVPEFVRPLLQLTQEYQMAGVLLCRMLKATPALAPAFIWGNMQYLLRIAPLIASRVLFLLCGDAEIRAAVSEFSAVYTFINQFLRDYPEYVCVLCKLVRKFPVNPATARRIARSGFLERSNGIAFGRALSAEVRAVLRLHATFDTFVLPRDYEDLIEYLKAAVSGEGLITKWAIAALGALISHPEARRVIVEKGVVEVLQQRRDERSEAAIATIVEKCTPQRRSADSADSDRD